MMELVKHLLEIQEKLKAPKGQYNDFGKYHYRSSEDILEAVKPLNHEKGLLLTLSDEPVLIGSYQYIKATATITDGKDKHSVTAFARESETKKGMDASQITGTASSYARKYALNGLYLIDDTKDADTNEHQQQGTKKPDTQSQQQQNNLITPAQKNALSAKVGNIAKSTDQEQTSVYESACKHFKISKPAKELTKAEASKIIDYLSKLEG